MLCNMVGLAYNLTKRGREREGPGEVVWGRWVGSGEAIDDIQMMGSSF